MCMREANNKKYQISIAKAWQDCCITHAGGIARVAVMAFDKLKLEVIGSTSQVEEEIQYSAFDVFKDISIAKSGTTSKKGWN